MWTRFAFLLIALAAASAEYGWKSGQQYTYKVTSKTLTGLHTAPQYSGLVFQADLVIRANSGQELIAVIDHAQKAEVHTQLQKGHEFEISKENLQFQPFSLTKQPFIIRLKEGTVDEVVISKEVPIWEVNVIKSIVSQLQVDTQGKRTIRSQMNMIPQENDLTAVYKTMEDTIEGECEVLYDISPLPKYLLQRKPYLAPLYEQTKEENMIHIVKTKNFTNCNHRPGYHYGITGMTQWEPTTNNMGNFLSRASVGRIILSGNLKTYTIHSSETTNRVTVTSELGSGEKSTVLSRVNLTLVSVTPTQQQVEQPTHPQTIRTLVYNYNHPTKKDQEARQQWDQHNELQRGTQGSNKGKKSRFGRSITDEKNTMNKKYSSDSSSSESSSISIESWHQETPKLTTVPQNPFLPYFVGCKGHSIQQCENLNVQQVVKKLSEQIGTQLQEPNHVPQTSTLERFSILVRVIRNMDMQQLKKVTEELWVKQEGESNVPNTRRSYWMAFRDAVAQAGTGPALVIIKEWILSDKIHGEEAAEVIASLTESTMHPTTEYMKTFFEIVKNQKVMNQKYFNTSAIYSFTKLVRFSQVDYKTIHNRYPVHVFGRFTPHDDKIVAEEFIPYFGAKLQQAVQEQDTPNILVYIRALGNMAHPKILSIFEPYLEGQFPTSDFQRTLIVVSLNDLAKTHPRIARSVLYKTFSNLGEVYQVRVAAVYNLMKTVPPVNMLQRMARATHEDPSIQVRSAIKSAIESAALLKNAVNMQLRRNAQAAVNMLTPEVFGIQYSRKNITDFILKDLNYGLTDVLSYIGSEDSNIPSSLFYGIRSQIHTYERKCFKAGAMVSSMQDLIDVIGNVFSFGENESQEQRGTEHGNMEWSYDKITRSLNVEHELMKQVEGTLLFTLAGAERYFTYDNHTLEALMGKLYQLPYGLALGPSMAYQKMYNSHNYQVAFPTVTGFPFVFTLETPRLLIGRGKVQVNSPKMSDSKNHQEITHFTGSVNVQGVYSSRTQSKVGFVTPFDHKHYVAGIHQEHQINVPVKMDVSVNLENFEVKVDVQPKDNTGDFKVFQYKSEKYTTIEDITEFKPITEVSNTKRIHIRQPEKFEHIIGEKSGLGLRVQVETQKRHLDWTNLLMALQRHNMISALVFPTAGETVENTKIDVYYDKTFARSFSVNMGAYGILLTGKSRRKDVATPNQPKMVQEVFGEIQRGIQSPQAIAVKLEFGVKGQSQHSATFGYGYSPVAEETKFVARYVREGGQQPYHLCLNVATKMPFVPETDFSKAVANHPTGQVSAELRFGQTGCQSGAQVTLAGKFERTPERTEYLKKLPQTQSCSNEMKNDNKLLSGCMNATYNANLLNRYILTVKYDKVPVVAKNITYQVYTFLRHLGHSYVSEKWNVRENAQEKKIDLDIHFSPDLKSVNTHVTSPLGSAHFQDVRVNKYCRSAFVLHPTMNIVQRFGWSALRQQYDAYCTIDKTRVRTFDNVTYPIHMTNQWIPVFVSVPKINQEGQNMGIHKVAILAKEVSGNKKEVMILTSGNSNEFSVFVQMKPVSESEVAVGVNGHEVKLQQGGKPYEHFDKNGNLIVRIYTVNGQEVKLEFPECDFNFLYTATRFQIFPDETYKNRVLGLCGDYNGERFDYVTPKGKYLRDPEEFVASWALTSDGQYSKLKERAEKNAVPKTVILTGVVSDQDAGRTDKRGRQYTQEQQLRGYYDSSSSSSSESREYDTECMEKRIMVVERDGKHCFSTNPQPSCKTGCQVEKTKPMTANFICVNKTQTSSHWAQMVTRGAQPNLGEKLNNVQELTFQAPTECSKI